MGLREVVYVALKVYFSIVLLGLMFHIGSAHCPQSAKGNHRPVLRWTCVCVYMRDVLFFPSLHVCMHVCQCVFRDIMPAIVVSIDSHVCSLSAVNTTVTPRAGVPWWWNHAGLVTSNHLDKLPMALCIFLNACQGPSLAACAVRQHWLSALLCWVDLQCSRCPPPLGLSFCLLQLWRSKIIGIAHYDQ